MIKTITKRRIKLVQVVIINPDRYKPFEIKLPANTVKVTGLMVTARERYGG